MSTSREVDNFQRKTMAGFAADFAYNLVHGLQILEIIQKTPLT